MRKCYRPTLTLLAWTLCFQFALCDALGCTAFTSDSKRGPLFARNYDFYTGEGLMVINPRNSTKISLPAHKSDKFLKWTSRYGSVTFNQFGVEFPVGGINEKGLVIESLWLEGTQYPEADKRGSLNELQWVQYQLDQYANITEVAENISAVRIAKLMAPLHYFVCDLRGQCLVAEFMNGRANVFKGADLPVRAIANNAYATSLQQRKFDEIAEGILPLDGGKSSPARFRVACEATREMEKSWADTSAGIAKAFRFLERAAQPGFTRWSVVYEMGTKTIHFRRAGEAESKTLRLDDVDFGSRKVEVWNLEGKELGDLRAAFLSDVDPLNRVSIDTGVAALSESVGKVPAGLVQAFKWYPRTVWR